VGSLYCYGTEDGIAALCEIGRGKGMELERLEGFMSIEQVAWAEDGMLVCVAQLGGKLSIKRVLRTGVTGEPVEVQQQLELQLPSDHGHITQLIFHRTRNQLLISTPNRLFLLDIETSELKQTELSQDIRARWVSHSALRDYLLEFGSTKMHIYEWESLKQLSLETRTYFPPHIDSRTSTFSTGPSLNRSGNSFKAERDVLGRLVASDADSSNILLQLWSSDASD
jgi:hypothetical protein